MKYFLMIAGVSVLSLAGVYAYNANAELEITEQQAAEPDTDVQDVQAAAEQGVEHVVEDVKAAVDEIMPEKKEYYEIILKDHKFSPVETIVPAGQKIKLLIDNQDPTPEEFESHDLSREKVIAGHKKAKIFVGPLKPGKYHFFGEFNEETAQGYLIVK
tara:strand:- start:5989 stop:6462 length:474 start_codon:yes stop_codon:yes gene_type:complete